MKATLTVEGFEPLQVTLVASTKPRFRVETNLTQWHVIDGDMEPEGAQGVGGDADHSIAMWQRNQFGDEICKRKCETLCKLLNDLHAKANDRLHGRGRSDSE
jgi:hypothetical protein